MATISNKNSFRNGNEDRSSRDTALPTTSTLPSRRGFISQLTAVTAGITVGTVLIGPGCKPTGQAPSAGPAVTRTIGLESYVGSRQAVVADLEALKGQFSQLYNGTDGAFDRYIKRQSSENYRALVEAYEHFDFQLMAMDSAFKRDIPQARINQDSRIRSGKTASAIQIVMNHEQDFANASAAKLIPASFRGGLPADQKDLELAQKAVAINFQMQSLTRAWSSCGELIHGFGSLVTVDSPHGSRGKKELVERQFRAVAQLLPLIDMLCAEMSKGGLDRAVSGQRKA